VRSITPKTYGLEWPICSKRPRISGTGQLAGFVQPPIPDNEDSVEIDFSGVELDETYPTQPSKSSAKRSLDITEIEGSFKRGVTSALQQRQLFVLERGHITAAEAAAFQLQATRSPDIARADVVLGRALDLLHICIMVDTTFTMLQELRLLFRPPREDFRLIGDLTLSVCTENSALRYLP
jgi:hypothetical protein